MCGPHKNRDIIFGLVRHFCWTKLVYAVQNLTVHLESCPGAARWFQLLNLVAIMDSGGFLYKFLFKTTFV